MSLTNGTTSTATVSLDLSAADICRIIKQCHTCGVKQFTYQGVRIKFHSHRNENAVAPGPETDYRSHSAVVSEIIETASDQMRLFDEESLLEAEQAQMLIDDPLGFERSKVDEHIERARSENGKA